MARITVQQDWRLTADPEQAAARERCRALERSDILYFPRTPLHFEEDDLQFLRTQKQSGAGYHKNIAYRPGQDRITGYAGAQEERMRAVLGRFSRAAQNLMRECLSPFTLEIEYASFRPLAEETRQLKTHARNDLLHVDNFPTRPTHGNRILRFFVNLHPALPRVWRTGPPLPELLARFGASSGVIQKTRAGVGKQKWLRGLQRLGLPVKARPEYDRFMLSFHHWLKENQEFQNDPGHARWEFPPMSSWMVFTDTASHAVLGGQFALEQTMLVKRQSLLLPEIAPSTLIENLIQSRTA